MKRTKKKPITALMIAAILLLSAFAGLAMLPKASAVNDYREVPYDFDDFGTFNRVYDYMWDGGYHIPAETAEYPDIAHLGGIITVQFDFLGNLACSGYFELRLLRVCTVYDENNNPVESNLNWIQTDGVQLYTYHEDGYYYWDVPINFYDGLYIGSNQGLNYYFPAAPQQFQHYKWDVQYEVLVYPHNWLGQIMWDYQTGNIYGTLSHDERSLTGTLCNWELCPGDSQLYGGTAEWTETWVSEYVATVDNPDGMLDYSPDSSYTELAAWSVGCFGRECVQLTGDSYGAYGPLWINYYTPAWSGCTLLTYVSLDGQSNWVFLGETDFGQQTMSPQWVNLGTPLNNDGSLMHYQYATFIAYDNGQYSDIYIDAIRTPYL